MKTKVLKCDCDHKVQDQYYGKNNRVHNLKSDRKTTNWRCSVCRKEK